MSRDHRGVSILTASTAHGTDLQDFSGTWTMQLNGHNLFVLNLVAAGEHMRGSFDRPAKISKMNSIFFNLAACGMTLSCRLVSPTACFT
jgi:hypothetical protein